jgi:hypothetical protein
MAIPGYYDYPFPVFQPSMRLITAITNANPASVTTDIPHQYVNNMVVRLDIPPAFGMIQANQLTGTIFITGSTTFLISIDTTEFQAFVTPPLPNPSLSSCAQVVPIGSVTGTLDLGPAVKNVLPYGANY